MTSRWAELIDRIQSEMSRVGNIYLIEKSSDANFRRRSYVVTLKKIPGITLEQRAEAFARCVFKALYDDEQLVCTDKCFRVIGDSYELCFCLEGYAKHPNQIGYVTEEGVSAVEMMHRMATEIAFGWMRANGGDSEKKRIMERMNSDELRGAYPNPAERFIASVRISKEIVKQKKRSVNNRSRLLHLMIDMHLSAETAVMVSRIVGKEIISEKKEETAKIIYEAIKDCKDEQEVRLAVARLKL